MELAWKAAIVIGLLVIVPWKFRIQTNATVVPAEKRVVSAEVSGVVQSVPVREGQTSSCRRCAGVTGGL